MTTTTDELVTEEIWIAFEDEYYRAKHTKGNTDSLRAALTAVAPSLIARGMREAKTGLPDYWQKDIDRRADAREAQKGEK